MTPPKAELFTISGLQVTVFTHPLVSAGQALDQGSLSCVFLLHGRLGCSLDLNDFANRLLTSFRSLIVVTFDHRNHGHRIFSPIANEGWNSGNARHAVDMYATQLGTAQDVSLLIDLLPAYLFPYAEGKITSWGVIGVSLGGHSTWLAAAHDSRINYIVPIIGSPDYEKLMSHRASRLSEKGHDISFGSPFVPASLLELIRRKDPCRVPMEVWRGKQILIVCGQQDRLVNFVDGGSETFINCLRRQAAFKSLDVFIDSDAQHEFTEPMAQKIIEWLLHRNVLQLPHL